ncbi:hypothetical protein [Paenibacillus sp. CH40]|nr:hypothetical protein [Paenibacillus sp. CH40]
MRKIQNNVQPSFKNKVLFKAVGSVAVHLNLEKRSVRLCRGILTF